MKQSFTKFKSKVALSAQPFQELPAEKVKEEVVIEHEQPENVDAIDKVESNAFLMPSDLDRPVYLMCPPFSLEAGSPNNAWMKSMSAKERKINRLKAIEQFFNVYAFVSNAALVYLLPSKKGLQDIPYVANLGIKLPHTNDNTIILANFKSEPRVDETVVGKDFFENLGYNTIIAPKYFEGEADLKFLHKNIYVGAYGQRTNLECLNWFRNTYNMVVVPLEMVDEKLYHLDCVIFPLEDHKLFVVTDVVAPKTIKALEKHTEIISIPLAIGHTDATNCVRMGGLILNNTNIGAFKHGEDEYVKEANKITFLENLCAKNGYEPVFFELSEFAKSGAALSCMFMHLNYPEYDTGEH